MAFLIHCDLSSCCYSVHVEMSRNALNYCVKCSGRINSDPLICGSGCGRVSHAKCSSLSEQQLKIIQVTPNISWRCDSCLHQASIKLELYLKQHEKRLEILEQSLASRKCMVYSHKLHYISTIIWFLIFPTGGKLNESCKEPVMCPFLPSTIASRAVFVTAAFAILTIGLLVILATTTNLFSKTLNKSKLGDGDDSRQNIPINSTIGTVFVAFLCVRQFKIGASNWQSFHHTFLHFYLLLYSINLFVLNQCNCCTISLITNY